MLSMQPQVTGQRVINKNLHPPVQQLHDRVACHTGQLGIILLDQEEHCGSRRLDCILMVMSVDLARSSSISLLPAVGHLARGRPAQLDVIVLAHHLFAQCLGAFSVVAPCELYLALLLGCGSLTITCDAIGVIAAG